LEKLQAAREDKDREHSIREQEIELNREAMERSKEKTELEKRSLLFRIKKLVESCKDAENSYDEAENMLETALKVLSDSEEFCFIHEIAFQGTISHSLLNKVISALTDFMEDMDEDDSDDLEFDSSFRRQVSHATFQTF
jgi:hypothetical protein